MNRLTKYSEEAEAALEAMKDEWLKTVPVLRR